MKHMKQIVCIVLSLILAGACIVSAGAAVTDDSQDTGVEAAAGEGSRVFYMGDSDVDGDVAITDATNIQRILAGYLEATFKMERLSDTNGNDSIDILDATMIQRFLAGLSCPSEIGEPIPARTMTFKNGYAQPFVTMSEVYDATYRNKGSDIIRFVVFVETDYDTDLDGKPDLVKAWVQIPLAAAEGDYQAPVIFEANPYSTNHDKISFPEGETGLDEALLKQTPPKRIPQGVATTEQLAENFRFSDIEDYSSGDYSHYYYFLSRGFAIVGSAGLGTRGSEGLELCGTAMEADAFKAIVEWIHGDRKAYSNLTDNLEVRADWSNGKTGMTGTSYMGTLAYEVAATGVEGLEAIAPNAGISSWYDYINQQGAPYYNFYHYSATLSGGCASRFYDGIEGDEEAYYNYLGWRRFVSDAERELKGTYGDIWDVRDFSQSNNIHASALIFQGLSDDNVRPKQFALMMDAYQRNGAVAKAVLHQGGHASLGGGGWSMKIGTYENYLWLVNRWFSYYLMDCDNGIDRLPNVIVQSNVDGKFYTYNSWESADNAIFEMNDGNGEAVIWRNNIKWWSQYITEATTIKGVVEVHLRVKADNLNFDKSAIKVDLVDLCTDGFSVYCGDNMGDSTVSWTSLYDEDDVRRVRIYQYSPKYVTQMFFTHGQVGLGTPDAGWEPQTSVASETPVQAGEWYDYVVYLEPEVYTVQPGHTLFIGVTPVFENFSGQYDSVGSITLDQSACYAIIPTEKTSTMPYNKYAD